MTFEIWQNGGVPKPIDLQCLRGVEVVAKWGRLENAHFIVFQSRQKNGKTVACRNILVLHGLRGVKVVAKWWRLENTQFAVFE